MAQRCRIQLLGGLRVVCGERVIARFRTHKTGALLAFLAYHLASAHPREALAVLLWPDSTPEAGQMSLRVALSSLRHQLEPPGTRAGTVLVADRSSVGLDPAAVATDVAEFEAALRTAEHSASEAERGQHLARAISLYGGPLLPGYYQDWIGAEQQRLTERYFRALESVTAQLEEAGDPDSALEHAWRAVAVEPFREEGHQHLMRLLGMAGQTEAALRHYQELERTLKEELGVAPSSATQQLAKQLSERAGKPLTVGRPAPTPSFLPSGIVTFLVADIPGEREALLRPSERGKRALAKQRAWLRQQFVLHGGQEVRHGGGYVGAAFARPTDALKCALACHAEPESARGRRGVRQTRVRLAMDTGEADLVGGRYRGAALTRAASLLVTAHPGQVLCAEGSAALLQRGLEPGVRLQSLGFYRLTEKDEPERIFSLVTPGSGPEAMAKPRAAVAYASSLPVPLDRFFGREAELAQLRAMFRRESTRLVTVTGPPGSGKTRLALELGRQLLEDSDRAVWFVPLQALADPDLIAGAVLEALELPARAGVEPLEQAAEALSRQPSLLVLDNFEQLVEGGALQLRNLLERAPALTCLVTSRRPLDLTGEIQFLLSPLPVPGGNTPVAVMVQSPSVQLFVDRAQTVRPDFQVTAGNAAAVSAICLRLEGIPLALELAAHRAQVLTPNQMLAQLGDRFSLLVSRKRDAEERHRSLQAAIEWSYALLSEELQRLFRSLSVFRGGWTAEAAAAVCQRPHALEYLTQLAECSLITAAPAAAGSDEAPRCWMLEILREYGDSLLSAEDRADLRKRHAHYYRDLAEEHRWQARDLAWELENLRAGLSWCQSAPDGTEAGLRLVAAARPLCWARPGLAEELRRHLMELLAREDAATYPAALIRALSDVGATMCSIGDMRGARPLLLEALAAARKLKDKDLLIGALMHLSWAAREQGLYEEARPLTEEWIALTHESGDDHQIVIALSMEAWTAAGQGDWPKARALAEEWVALCRRMGDEQQIAGALTVMAEMALDNGDCPSAVQLIEEAQAICREAASRAGAGSDSTLGGPTAAESQPPLWGHSDTLAVLAGLDEWWRPEATRGMLAAITWWQGDRASARATYEAELAAARESGSRGGIGWAAFLLGAIILEDGAAEGARPLLRESLEVFRQMGAVTPISYLLGCFPCLLLDLGKPEAAARLLGAVELLSERRDGGPISLPPDPRSRRVSAATAALSASAFDEFRAEGRSMDWEQAAAFALEQTA
ncbi:MAG: BTAD domain-containing putative transcriptional regulator [Armatimonadota bacterium]